MDARHHLACLCLALNAIVGCAPQPDGPLAGHNLIVVNIDALRADRLGCYGNSHDNSPFIDSLCRDAVVFERATAASSFTRESVAALFTGRLPSKSGALGWRAEPGGPDPTLAERLQEHGFRTALISNSVMLNFPGFARGFDDVRHLPRRWGLSGEGTRLSASALEFVDSAGSNRFFLYLHYLDPHAPYEPAPRFHGPVPAAPGPAPIALYDDAIPNLARLRKQGFGPGEARFDDLEARYEAEIRATDAALAQLFRGLDERGVLDDTLVVLTADHGEEFLEHGYLEHGWTLYEEVLRVPLLFWARGALTPERVPVRASQVDLLPTLLEMLGLPVGDSAVDGAPLFVRSPKGFRPATLERAQIAELLLPRRQIVRAVLQGDWKYIATWREVDPEQRPVAHLRPPSPAPDLWGAPIREELYQLAQDPGERHDRLLTADGARRRLTDALERFRAAGPNHGFAPTPEGDAPGISHHEAERLRALGYQE